MLFKIFLIELCIVIVLPLYSCTLSADSHKKNWSSSGNKQLLIISTIDGKISALDIRQQGKLLWSIDLDSGPLISSSITKLVYEQNGKTVRLIPSLHGGLYKFYGDTVEAVPFDADQLLKSSFRLADNTVLVGGKETCFTGVDAASGNILYSCSVKGCDKRQAAQESSDLFVIKGLQQTVRSIENRNGAENWNFSVCELDMEFLQGSESRLLSSERDKKTFYSKKYEENSDYPNDRFDISDMSRIKFVVPDGIVCMMTQKNENILWKHSFSSAVASAWILIENRLHKIDMFNAEKLPSLQKDYRSTSITSHGVIYMGSYKSQVYIQASPFVQRAITQAINSNFQNAVGQVNYNPPRFTIHQTSKYLKLSGSTATNKQQNTMLASTQNNVITSQVGKHLLLSHDDTNLNKGFYFQGDLSIYSRIQTNSHKGLHTTIANNISEKSDSSKTFFMTLILSIVLMLLISYISYRYVYAKYLRDFSTNASSVHNDSNNVDLGSNANPKNYESRFFQDFETEKCLGKGGFGVVFKAKNKMDNRSYAVKRIRLPHGDQARDKVLREVRVLAQLDHPSIVRYFNSWSEQPPPGWQDEKDKTLLDDLSVLSSVSQQYTEEKTGRKDTSRRETLPRDFASVGFDYEMTDRNSKHLSLSCDSNEFIKQTPPFGEMVGNSWTEATNQSPASVHLQGKFYRDDSDSSTDCGVIDGDSSIPFRNYQSDGISIVFEEESKIHSNDNVIQTVASPAAVAHSTVKSHEMSLVPSKDQETRRESDEKKVFLYIQMQLCKEESLKEWLNSRRHNREKAECIAIFQQVVDAVKYIHEQELIHRDLKPSNVLFSLNGTIKVGDFGLVTSVGESSLDSSSLGGGASRQHTRHVGTMLYMAPEQMTSGNYTSKVDIYALGLILFELFHAFDTQMEKVKHFADVRRLKFPACFTEKHPHEKQLISSMLERDAQSRPSANKVSEDQIFRT